jgi:predicted TIM-barrel enzyme
MEFHYADTAEIKVSVGMTTSNIKQVIDFLKSHDATLEEGGLDKLILGNRIAELQAVYQRAMNNISQYAEGQKTDV